MGKKVEELPFSIKCRQSAQNSSLDIIHSFMGITLEVSVSRKTIFFFYTVYMLLIVPRKLRSSSETMHLNITYVSELPSYHFTCETSGLQCCLFKSELLH